MYQANENSHVEIRTYTINNVLNQNVKVTKRTTLLILNILRNCCLFFKRK